MLSVFTNIDSEASVVTKWKSIPHDDWFDSIGLTRGYQLGYTVIDAEIPLLRSGDSGAYWSESPVYKTKLSANNSFTTRYEYLESSFEAFLDGEKISVTHVPGGFTVPVTTDGYLFVQYVPASAAYSAGNKVSDLAAAGIRAKYITPRVEAAHISRCRKAINNLQYHVEYAITPWIGGAWNSEKSSADNIIPSRTEITLDHITEMQIQLRLILAKVNTYNPTNETAPAVTISLSNVANAKYFRVEYLEEIRKAINDIEGELIRKLSL